MELTFLTIVVLIALFIYLKTLFDRTKDLALKGIEGGLTIAEAGVGVIVEMSVDNIAIHNLDHKVAHQGRLGDINEAIDALETITSTEAMNAKFDALTTKEAK